LNTFISRSSCNHETSFVRFILQGSSDITLSAHSSSLRDPNDGLGRISAESLGSSRSLAQGTTVHLERRLRIDHRILVCVSVDVCATFTGKPYMRRRRVVVVVIVGIRSYRFAVSSNYLCTRTADARHCKYTYLQHSMAR